ncbi:Glycogenin-2 [Fukomys damarensis]|uniref:glycogenin glucosyltransferase n=1 Tax=Fukomys damarensis TaxID=885580 RepID=A0A091DJ16_FUKDA|nr:Glycogenin-2 [Fukomys damarensis]
MASRAPCPSSRGRGLTHVLASELIFTPRNLPGPLVNGRGLLVLQETETDKVAGAPGRRERAQKNSVYRRMLGTQYGYTQQPQGVIPGIIGAVVVAVAGAISSFIAYQKKKWCFKGNAEHAEVDLQNCQTTSTEPPGHWNNADEGYQPPRPKPPAAGGAGGGGAGGGGYNSYGDTQGNTIARIVSPIVSVVVVALVGAGVSFFKSNRRGNCLRASGPWRELKRATQGTIIRKRECTANKMTPSLENSHTPAPPAAQRPRLFPSCPEGFGLRSPSALRPSAAPASFFAGFLSWRLLVERFVGVTDQAFVTLAANDLYCQGALVLGQSLRNHGTARKLVVLITPQVSGALRVVLSRVFDEVIEVNLSGSEDRTHLAFRKRPELGVTLTKLHCWTLTQYSKGVFLDPDTLVLCNIDELFERREFSAAPDPGWPDCFNSGVFVFRPSLQTHARLLQHAIDHGSFDGADQGLLNGFFRNWASADIHKHLPFIYNLSSSTVYTYGPAFQQFGASAKVIHFLGPRKPWSYTYHPQTGSVVEQGSGVDRGRPEPFLSLWWAVYHAQVLPLYARGPDAQTRAGHSVSRPGADVSCGHWASGTEERWESSARSTEVPPPAPSALEPDAAVGEAHPFSEGGRSEDTSACPETEASAAIPSEPQSPPPPSAECPARPSTSVDLAVSLAEVSIREKVRERSPEEERRQWEQGRMDYLGRDAFARIQEKLDRFLQ